MAIVSDSALVRLSLRRPVAMMMVLLSMLVLGGIALVRIPLELVPSGFSPPFLRVQVSFPDATAKDVEERITRPLEGAVATTPGIETLSSSSSSGRSSITILFKADTDMNIAYRQVRDRVARVRPDLPEEVDTVEIRKESAENIPVAFYALSWDAELASPHEAMDTHLLRPIQRIDGVGLVDTFGRKDREVQIDVDRVQAEALGIEMIDLVQSLSRSNFTMASGEIQEADGQYLLRSVAAWESTDAIGNIIVTPQGNRLRDIATVKFDRPEETRYDRYRGRPSIVMFVLKESQANTVEVCDRIKQVVEEAQDNPALSGFTIEPVFVQGDTIRASLDQVLSSGEQGGLLAIFVLVFFLRRVRLTLIISASIPLSLFLALPFMYFTDQTINLVSLIGLMICIGLVVDNSVVVAENINRYRRRGLPPYAAALQGASEVGLAMTLATATTIIVFLPAALLSEGATQFFMVRMVTPVCVSLAASLFVALVLVPLASVTLLRDRPQRPHGRIRTFIDRIDASWKAVVGWLYKQTAARISSGYVRLLRVCLRRRMDVVVISLLALASTAIPAMNVQCESGRNFGTRNMKVHYSMPSDTTLEEADAFFKEIEKQMEVLPAEYGVDGAYIGFDANQGQVQLFFLPPTEGERPYEERAKELAELMPERPGWKKFSEFGDSDGAEDDSFHVVIYGDEHERVQAAREVLEQQLLEIEGVIGLRKFEGDDRRREELALSVERTMSERFGVPATVVANTVASSIRGSPLPRFHTDEREVDVRIRYRESDRENVDQLLRYKVPSLTGGEVPLGVLADKEVTIGESRLTRTNKRVGALIRLELDGDDRQGASERVVKYLRAYELPEGLSFDAAMQDKRVDDMQKDLAIALGMGLIFVFLVMGFLFESVVLPLSVLPTVPVSFVGVWWLLYATGENIDALAGIGMLLLLGVVVNNGIVLIDFISTARAQGMAREDAIAAAAKLRFRPIMMTALTTIGGMLPLAFTQHTGEGIPYGPFGKALVGGMTTATFLTLVVVPVAYTYLDDLRTSALGWWHRLLAVVRRKRD